MRFCSVRSVAIRLNRGGMLAMCSGLTETCTDTGVASLAIRSSYWRR
jgi:hypothetical protein